jgi:hypothetical protein
MILAFVAGAVAVVAAGYYLYKHSSALAAVKAEVAKVEAAAKVDYSAASADVKAYIVKLEAFVASVKAKI